MLEDNSGSNFLKTTLLLSFKSLSIVIAWTVSSLTNDQEEADVTMKINIEINSEIYEADIENSSPGKAF